MKNLSKEQLFTTLTILFVGGLTLTLAGLAFYLSYEVLVKVAHGGGKDGLSGWLWPLLIDGPIIVFSALVFYAIFFGHNKAKWIFRLLIVGATGLTIWFNFQYAELSFLDPVVYLVPPIIYVFVFESFAWLLGGVVDRIVTIEKSDALHKMLSQLQQTHKKAIETDNAEYEKWTIELSQKRQHAQTTFTNLEADIAAAKQTMANLNSDIEIANKGPMILVPEGLTIDQRRGLVGQLNGQYTHDELATIFGVSASTIKNDRAAVKVPVNGKH